MAMGDFDAVNKVYSVDEAGRALILGGNAARDCA
jgi:hypothetical protein